MVRAHGRMVGDDGAVSTEPIWTLVEAAERTGMSRATLQRLVVAGKIPGAHKVGRGWKVPMSGLLASGLVVGEPSVSAPREVEQHRALIEARAEADRHRMRAESLERELRRADEQIADLRRVLTSRLLMLEPAPERQGERSSPQRSRWRTLRSAVTGRAVSQ